MSSNIIKKIDIQEANKHLQLLHERNIAIEQELENKSTQLSKVEAQLEDVTLIKQREIGSLSIELDILKEKHECQRKETEQWKMLVHERDVMIAKLQTKCRQLEELESQVYECRPSLEALLSMTYQMDGTDVDSQTAAKPLMIEDEESVADYAIPDHGETPDAEPVSLPLTFNLVNNSNRKQTNGHMMSVSKVQHFLQNQSVSGVFDTNANNATGDSSRLPIVADAKRTEVKNIKETKTSGKL